MSAALTSAIERPKRGFLYPAVMRDLAFLRDTPDPQRKAVYRWQQAVLADMSAEDVLGSVEHAVSKREARATSVAYIEHLWKSHAPNFRPYFRGVPHLKISYSCASMRPTLRRSPLSAHASPMRHAIFCPLSMLHRRTIVHEICHLLAWRDRHGPEFCAALVYLWADEFHIERAQALRLADEHGVQVAL